MKLEVLYVFGGEKAQGAEIVIERLMEHNAENVNAHLMLSPGAFANKLIAAKKPFKILCVSNLKKLYRSSNNRFNFYRKALINYFVIPHKVYRYVKANDIKVIHVNTIVPASYLLPLVSLSKLVLPGRLWIWSDHDMKYFSRLDQILSKWCLRTYDYTFVVSQAVKRKYPETNKTFVLYNGLDTSYFNYNELARKIFRERLNINQDDIVFGIAASICPGKGQLHLIKVFTEAVIIYPKIKLLIVGDFALDDITYNTAVKKSIESNVNIIYLGFIDNIINFYNGCDVIVSNSDLSRSESLGTSIYEAMACEKIVIASATGGTPEIITDNVDGFLFEAENGNALKERILHIIGTYSVLQDVKIAAREKVIHKFSIEGMARSYNSFLAEHCRGRFLNMKSAILYIFGGEKAQGAEIVIERLMYYNRDQVINHLFISPGKFANVLLEENKPYKVTLLENLRKLNRNKQNLTRYIFSAFNNYLSLSYNTYCYIKANKIDIVHANTVVPASYLIPLIIYSKLFLRSTKWFWSDHDISYYNKMDSFLSRMCARVFDGTLTVSEAVKTKYRNNQKVHVLYNGLDPEVFKPDAGARDNFRKRLNINSDIIVLGMPAVVHPRKGQLELLHVFSLLCKQFQNVLLLLSGGFEEATPEYSEKVKVAVAANELTRHIGFVTDMVEFYCGCDIVVNNSNLSGSEPLGTTIYEAMACEKIVVASATGGTSEIINDGIDGLLFTAEDNDDLKNKLAIAIRDINDLTTVRKCPREKVISKFNIAIMVEEYDQFLN